VRIAALVLIADAGYERIAIVGFHSQAGWIAFNLAALGVAIVAKRSTWLNRSAQERSAAGVGTGVGIAGVDATAAYLMPLLAILASAMLVRAVSAGFDLLYPLRLVSAAIVLWVFRRSYRSLDWRFSWRGISVGVGVFCVWALFARFLTARAAMPEELANLAVPLRGTWIACRAAAAIITVPIAEELAYRGYLMRRIAGREFDTLPLSSVSTLALVASAIAFGLTHGAMWPAGIAAGLSYGLIAIRTGKIGEAVAAHAASNALVAIQVLLFGQWQLW
jgi:exosortase E/protease (VPEID-CTERM system)